MKTSRVPSKTGSSAAIEPAPRLSAKEQTQAPASPRNGSARGRAKGPAKHAEPAAELMTTGVLSNSARHRIRALALGD